MYSSAHDNGRIRSMKWSCYSNAFKQRFIPSLVQETKINLMNMLHICSNLYAYVTTSQKHICHMCALQNETRQCVKLSN